MKHLFYLSVSLVMVCACSGGNATGTDADTTPPVVGDPTVAGTYETSGTWDLSGPFAGGITVGELVADLVVDKVISGLGVPSAFEDKAKKIAHDLLYEKIRDFVNDNAPPEFAQDSELMLALSSTFASVQIDTRLILQTDPNNPDELVGTEQIIAMAVPYNGATVDIPLDALKLEGEDTVVIMANVTGQILNNGAISLDDHTFEIRFDQLVAWAIDQTLGVDVAALSAQFKQSVGCDAILNLITGGTGEFKIGVGGFSYTVKNDKLSAMCGSLEQKVTDKVLGFFGKDTGLTVGGDVTTADLDGDLLIDDLKSQPGYGGELTSLPGPLDPAVKVTFIGARVTAN